MPLFLAACFAGEEDEAQEARQLNDQQIQQYIADNNLNAQGTGSGLFYTITQPQPNGQVVQDGDSIKVHFLVRLVSGTIVDSTAGVTALLAGQTPARLRSDNYLIDITPLPLGFEEGLRLMKEGEKALLLVPSYLAFGGNGNTVIPPFSVLIYEVFLEEVRSEEEMMEEYIIAKGLNVTISTETGLRYVRQSPGTPDTAPTDNQTVIVTYRGTLLDDREFDANDDSTFSVQLGAGRVIAGWDEGLKLMNQGETGIFIMPSSLAYGRNGTQSGVGGVSIPPYAPLVFEITLVKDEIQQIYEYVANNGLQGDTLSTSTGLRYAILSNGTGATPAATASVSIRYTASYLQPDGQSQIFAQETLAPVTLNLESTDVFLLKAAGIKEGIQLMKEGERRILLMTSALGYGNTGQQNVPGRAPLVVEIELVDIL
ncbi:MAG: hypothetical protein OHK0053_18140 [Microscillaceae bacterium]